MNYVLTPKAVRRLIPLVRGVSGGTTTTYPPGTVSPDGFPPPYTVQWAQSENSDAGAWLIWLPGSSLLMWDDSALDIITPLTAATNYPSGWYTIADTILPATGGTLHLHVTPPNGTTPASAAWSGASGSTGIIDIPVCNATRDATTGEVLVKPCVDSALILASGYGSGGGGLSGTVEFVADADWYVNGSVHVLRKRLRILDLATGQVTDKPGTTYGDGWELLANTTPISNIINGGS